MYSGPYYQVYMVEFFRENSQWIKDIQMFFFLFSFYFLPKISIRDFLGL